MSTASHQQVSRLTKYHPLLGQKQLMYAELGVRQRPKMGLLITATPLRFKNELSDGTKILWYGKYVMHKQACVHGSTAVFIPKRSSARNLPGSHAFDRFSPTRYRWEFEACCSKHIHMLHDVSAGGKGRQEAARPSFPW